MERGVETSNLRQTGKAPMERLGEQDFLRQMLRIKRREPMQFRYHLGSDALMLDKIRTAMHHAMAHASQSSRRDSFLDPIHEQVHRRRMIGSVHGSFKTVR